MQRPEITADMKVIRNANNALIEVVDNAVDAILDQHHLFGIENPDLTDDERDILFEFVWDLVTRGQSGVEF